MSKSNLVQSILLANPEMTKKDAEDAVKTVFEGISDTLKQGKEISMIGFGKFSINHQPEKEGRNPSTGQPMTIAAKNVVRFKPGATLKETVNS